MRRNVSTGSPYEPRIGISRAVRVGPVVSVAGTAPIGPNGATVGPGDPALQTRRCLEIVRDALERAGASLSDVVRTRILLTRIEDWEAVAVVHGEFFGDVRPASTIVQVVRFIDPDWLVEIEADAVVERRQAALAPEPSHDQSASEPRHHRSAREPRHHRSGHAPHSSPSGSSRVRDEPQP